MPNLRRTTTVLLFESIAKITKEKYLSESNSTSSISNNITTTSSISSEAVDLEDNKFEKDLIFIQETTQKIEETMYGFFKDAKEKYIRKAKAIISNLRFNCDLYLALFEEKITANQIAEMDEKVKLLLF